MKINSPSPSPDSPIKKPNKLTGIQNYSFKKICNFSVLLHTPVYMAKVKVKLSLCLTKHHAMKTYWGWRYSNILDLSTRRRWV